MFICGRVMTGHNFSTVAVLTGAECASVHAFPSVSQSVSQSGSSCIRGSNDGDEGELECVRDGGGGGGTHG